jgi:hypothetical protein
MRQASRFFNEQSEQLTAVHNAQLKALEHLDQFTPGTSMEAWLSVILRNELIDLYRKNQRWKLFSFQQSAQTSEDADFEFDLDKEEALFIETINLLNDKMEINSFQKYYPNKNNGVFEGGFSTSIYESILPGLASNIDKYREMPNDEFVAKIKEMYTHSDFIKYIARGNKAIYRIKGLNEFSHTYFN